MKFCFIKARDSHKISPQQWVRSFSVGELLNIWSYKSKINVVSSPFNKQNLKFNYNELNAIIDIEVLSKNKNIIQVSDNN